MSNVVSLAGTLTTGPSTVCDGAFPGATTQIAFALSGACGTQSASKQFYAAPMINSASAFVALVGVGTLGPVTKATFLYLRTNAQMKIRLTFVDFAGGPDIVSIIEVMGLLILEPPVNGWIKLIEAQGVGSIEYLAAGNE